MASAASWVEVELKQSRETDPKFIPIVYYKPASVRWDGGYYSAADFKIAEPLPSSMWEKVVYRFPIAEDDADVIYARASTWSFVPDVQDEKSHWQDHMVNVPVNLDCILQSVSKPGTQLTYIFNAFAHRGPMP